MYNSDQFSTASFNRVSNVKTNPRICKQFERSYDANVRSGAAFEGARHFHQVFFLTLLRPGARVFKSPLPGAEMITFLAPASMCPAALVFHKIILILIKLSSLTKQFANQPCANSTQSDLLLHIDIQVLHLLRLDEKPSGLNHILHSHFLEGSNQ